MKQKFVNVVAFLVLALSAMWACSGCSIMNTGPELIAQSLDATGATMTTLVGKFDPKNMTARAGMKVNNPEFVMETVVAPAAFYIKSTLRLIGAEAGAEVSAAGVGSALDPEVVAIFERGANKPGDIERLLEWYEKNKPKTAKTNEGGVIGEGG